MDTELSWWVNLGLPSSREQIRLPFTKPLSRLFWRINQSAQFLQKSTGWSLTDRPLSPRRRWCDVNRNHDVMVVTEWTWASGRSRDSLDNRSQRYRSLQRMVNKRGQDVVDYEHTRNLGSPFVNRVGLTCPYAYEHHSIPPI